VEEEKREEGEDDDDEEEERARKAKEEGGGGRRGDEGKRCRSKRPSSRMRRIVSKSSHCSFNNRNLTAFSASSAS